MDGNLKFMNGMKHRQMLIRTVIGGVRNLNVEANGEAQSINYLIPNQNQCKNCHDNGGEIDPDRTFYSKSQ